MSRRNRPPKIENLFDEPWPPIPRVEDGAIIYPIGRIEITVTKKETLTEPPRVEHKFNNWQRLPFDREMYNKLEFLNLSNYQAVWWRERERYDELEEES
jgi:hypothetical protein